ncbi:MAG: polysaccharide deacetylase [Gammaproteobacteria bacterium]|nr:polysaccharide deacetylase [Gammaproteobacteria bacterium]
MLEKKIAIKIDVDTDRGTRIGVPHLLELFSDLAIPATFLFSLGPDNTGRAIKRLFRPGFLKKVSRSGVVRIYGIRTLLNGLLLPGPHIGKRNQNIMLEAYKAGHEVGIHCYDHIRWQDGLMKMKKNEVEAEFEKAFKEFKRIFGFSAKTAGAAGWQANAFSLAAYDEAKLFYASDARGSHPFYPRIGETIFKTLQIPTNLPTLDELLGRPDYPLATLADFYLNRLVENTVNTFTAHAEIEGMRHLSWFKDFLLKAKEQHIKFIKVEDIARQCLDHPADIPICDLVQGEVDGRSGTMAVQA